LDNLKHQPGKERCRNKTWNAAKLEDQIWTELQRFLSNRDLIKGEMDRRQDGLGQVEALEDELKQVEHQLKTVEQEQHQLLQWALKGFPENQVESENRRLNKSKTILKARRAELQAQIKVSVESCANLPDIERFIDEIQKRLPNLDFEGKRLALDMLGINVYIDGQTAEVKGVIAPENDMPRCSSDQSRLTTIGNTCAIILTLSSLFLQPKDGWEKPARCRGDANASPTGCCLGSDRPGCEIVFSSEERAGVRSPRTVARNPKGG
jgi:hypothetical protein